MRYKIIKGSHARRESLENNESGVGEKLVIYRPGDVIDLDEEPIVGKALFGRVQKISESSGSESESESESEVAENETIEEPKGGDSENDGDIYDYNLIAQMTIPEAIEYIKSINSIDDTIGFSEAESGHKNRAKIIKALETRAVELGAVID